MSDDLLRTARQLLTELDATESYLRSIAGEVLSYSQFMAMDRRASNKCADLLNALGGTAFEFALDDTTDEVLLGRRRAAAEGVRQSTSTQIMSSGAKEHAAEAKASAKAPARAETRPEPARSSREPPPAAPPSAARPAKAPAKADSYVTYEGEEVDDDAATIQARRSSSADGLIEFDNLVTFDDPVVSATPETVVRTVAPASKAGKSDVPDPAESFDLIPEGSGFEDEEVTVVKTAASVSDAAGKPKNLKETARAEARTDPPPRPEPARPAAKQPEPAKRPTSNPPPKAEPAKPAPAPAAARPSEARSTPPPASPPKPVAAARAPEPARPAAPPPRPMDTGAPASTKPPARAPASAAPARAAPATAAASQPLAASAAAAAPAPATPRRPPPAAPPAGAKPAPRGGSARVTSGLYGGSSVPTIRESDEPRPRAAAVQLNPSGSGGRVLGAEEEDEPIEVGAADYEDEIEPGDGGFAVKLQQYAEVEDEEEEAGELSEEDLEVIQPAAAVPVGPTPEEVRQMVLRAQNASASGSLQVAADLYSDVIDADPDNVPAHVARGRLYLDLGDYSRAMSDFMVAEDIAPNDPEPQVAIGDLYFARKDYAKAIEYFNDALRFSPNHPMAHCRRGISHYYRKNYREAVDDLLRAERLDPDIPNIQTYVSMARKKVKR